MTVAISTLIKDASAQTLGALGGILKKGADHAAAHKLPEEVFLNFRLFLAGTDLPSFPDVETSFAQLIERAQKANAYVQAASADAMNGRTQTVVNIPVGGGQEMPMTCAAYLQSFVFPNLYFHVSAAYGILRHNGVVLGKRDYLRPPG